MKVAVIVPLGRPAEEERVLSVIEGQRDVDVFPVIVRDPGNPAAKRNLGIRRAAQMGADCWVSMDDDDAYGPRYVATMVKRPPGLHEVRFAPLRWVLYWDGLHRFQTMTPLGGALVGGRDVRFDERLTTGEDQDVVKRYNGVPVPNVPFVYVRTRKDHLVPPMQHLEIRAYGSSAQVIRYTANTEALQAVLAGRRPEEARDPEGEHLVGKQVPVPSDDDIFGDMERMAAWPVR